MYYSSWGNDTADFIRDKLNMKNYLFGFWTIAFFFFVVGCATTQQEGKKIEKPRTLEEFKSLINRGVTTQPGKLNIALVIESKKGKHGTSPENLLYNLLKAENVNVIVNLFKEEIFKARGFFGEIYGGDTEFLKQADALEDLDGLILGRLHYSFPKRVEADRDLFSCNINFSYKVINKNGNIIKIDSISVIGPGFSEDAAMKRGLEMLSEKYSERILKPAL